MWPVVNRQGCTRVVFLIGEYAIKIPTIYSWEMFLHGLLANCKERWWAKHSRGMNEPMLPPIVWVCPGGWMSIQRRVRPIRHRGLFYIELYHAIAKSKVPDRFWLSDLKPENFGWYQGRLVKIDLG